MTPTTPGDTPPSGSLRVATYNIHKGVVRELFGLRRVSIVHALRSRLHELDADYNSGGVELALSELGPGL